MTSLKLSAAFISDIGMKRKQNQDNGLCHTELGLFMVADGMGGHQGGERASQLCVDKVLEHVSQYSHIQNNDREILSQSLLIANQTIFELAEQNAALKGMGTTATILKISNNLATIAQVGDSRIYFYSPRGLWQLTRDHSLVQEKLRAQLISRAQLKTDHMKNVITRSVGYEPNMKTDIYTMEVESGDLFLLCSDGLTGPLEDRLIFEILEETLQHGSSLAEAAQKLIQSANAHGGDDNVTVLLVKVESSF